MADFVSALTNSTTGLTSSTLWSEVTAAAPLIILIFTFVFGYRVVKKILKKGARGSFGI